MKPVKEWREIGVCGVDSGQLMIIDPCYLSDWRDGELDLNGEEAPDKNSYDAVCRTTLAQPMMAGETREGGVVFSSGYGDGSYPVMAYYNADSVITEIRIKMD